MRYYCIPVRMTKIKIKDAKYTKNWIFKQRCREIHTYTAGENINWYNYTGKRVWQFLKKLNMKLPYELIIPLLVIIQEKIKHMSMQRFVYTYL